MSKNLKSTENKNVTELCNQLVAEFQELKNSIANNDNYASNEILQTCEEIVKQLDAAHKMEYKRISSKLSSEIFGDIIRLNPNSKTDVQETGIDSVKTIVFNEMGFNAHERIKLEQ